MVSVSHVLRYANRVAHFITRASLSHPDLFD